MLIPTLTKLLSFMCTQTIIKCLRGIKMVAYCLLACFAVHLQSPTVCKDITEEINT